MEAQRNDGRSKEKCGVDAEHAPTVATTPACSCASSMIEPNSASVFGTPSRRAVVGAGCAVALGALVAGTGLGAYMASDDPMTDTPHGRGPPPARTRPTT